MSVRIDRWFGVPPELFESGQFARLSHSAVRLCVFLYWKSDRQTSRRFRGTDKEIGLAAGVSPRSLAGARKQLANEGVARFERDPGGEYTYTLCDPKTGKPYPGDPKSRVGYTKPGESKRANPEPNRSTQSYSNSTSQVRDGTDFDFGLNSYDVWKSQPEKPKIDPKDFNPFT